MSERAALAVLQVTARHSCLAVLLRCRVGTMPRSSELLSRYSLVLLAHAQELRQEAAAARERSTKLRTLAKEAALVGQAARAMVDAMRKRQGER
jgi:hypothetical protein